jgi:pyruvate/2-oxoglutarate dehydrogenase complex dihydrolipoamide acyltransferase (E2) component
MPFIIKAMSLALHEWPTINSSLAVGAADLVQHTTHNIGVAMNTGMGLVVPNVKQARRMGQMSSHVIVASPEQARASACTAYRAGKGTLHTLHSKFAKAAG